MREGKINDVEMVEENQVYVLIKEGRIFRWESLTI